MVNLSLLEKKNAESLANKSAEELKSYAWRILKLNNNINKEDQKVFFIFYKYLICILLNLYKKLDKL